MNAIKRSMPMQTCTVKVYECGFLTAVEASLNKNPRIYTPSKMLHCMYPATSERNQTNRLKLVITSKNLMFEQYFQRGVIYLYSTIVLCLHRCPL